MVVVGCYFCFFFLSTLVANFFFSPFNFISLLPPLPTTTTTTTGLPNCKTCDAGKTNIGVGLTNCESCPPGRVLTALPLDCSVCPAGKFQNISHVNPNIKCQNCLGRYIIDDGKDDKEHVSCKYCPKGKEFNSVVTLCDICMAGKYQISNDIASAACKDCPSGLYLTNTASNADEHNQLEDCKHCPIAYEYTSPTTMCKICSGGRYQDNGTSFDLKCKFCPANYFIVDDSDDADYHNSDGDCKFLNSARDSFF